MFLWVAVTLTFAAIVINRPSPRTAALVGSATPPARSGINTEEVATILFGASSVALILLSLLAAVTAIIGWQALKEQTTKEVEASTQRRIDALEQEVRGRLSSVVGHTLGSLSTRPTQWEPLDADILREAVQQCQRGYELLETLGDRAKFMALNNLVYYSSVLGDRERAPWLMEQARLLKATGDKHNSVRLRLTFCRAALRYAADDAAEASEVRRIAASFAEGEVTKEERAEAKFYLDLLDKGKSLAASAPAATS